MVSEGSLTRCEEEGKRSGVVRGEREGGGEGERERGGSRGSRMPPPPRLIVRKRGSKRVC